MVKNLHFHASTAEVMGSDPGLNPHARWCSEKKKKRWGLREMFWALSLQVVGLLVELRFIFTLSNSIASEYGHSHPMSSGVS